MSCRLAMFHGDDVRDIQQNLPDYIELNLFGMLENGGVTVHPVTLERISWRLCSISDELDAVAKYVEERGRRLVDPLVSALEAHGVSAQPVFVEDDDPSRAIVETAAQL